MIYLKVQIKNNKLYLCSESIEFSENIGFSKNISEEYPLYYSKYINGYRVLGFCGFEETTQLRKLEKISENCKKELIFINLN